MNYLGDMDDGTSNDTDLARWEAWRETTTSRHACAVTTLLTTRPELRGISALADTVEESVRWAA